MALLILIHALVFLAFWLTNLPYQESLNNFLISATRLRMDYLLIFMIFGGLVAVWSAVQLMLRRKRKSLGTARAYLYFGVFFLVFFYASFAVLFLENPAQFYRLGQLFQYFRLIVDASLLMVLAWGVRRRVKVNSMFKKVLLSTTLLIIWLIPVFMPPGNVYRGALPGKPLLIAHRGASTLAPENTLASMQAAASLGVYGVESDITISADGVLFLMHDNTLTRTTDVSKIFPGREEDLAEAFTWAELSRLDAGSWFDGRSDASRVPIPTLNALLQVVNEKGLYFIYDLRIPSAGHPYAGQTLELCLDAIKTAAATPHTWVLTQPDAVAQIRSILPDAVLAKGIGYSDTPPAPGSLVADGFQVVNSVFGLSNSKIHAYQKAGLWVNLWVVDEPWQYSRLWLAGANSVTSNRVQTLLALQRPVLAMPFGTFLSIWGLLGVIAALIYWRAIHK